MKAHSNNNPQALDVLSCLKSRSEGGRPSVRIELHGRAERATIIWCNELAIFSFIRTDFSSIIFCLHQQNQKSEHEPYTMEKS
jgi:hypothetical protein